MTAESRFTQEPTRVLVIGAGGFVGQHLLAHLLEEAETPLHITATVLPGLPNPPAPFPDSPRSSALCNEEPVPSPPTSLPSRERKDSPFPVSATNESGKEAGKVGNHRMALCKLDICDAKAVDAVVAEARPHYIYHLAARHREPTPTGTRFSRSM
jgi:nucleoside-diphosphate-sugar epimerase